MLSNDILTIEEVAKYLRVSERTVYEWAQKGDIPAGKIGTAWRFKRTEIERWVNERLPADQRSPVFPLPVSRLISPDRVLFLEHRAKRDVLAALAENLAACPQVKNRQELIMEILKRDELMSTAIGRGIAIPHVRLSSVTDLVISVGISKTDIVDFQTLDDEPVRLVIMIAAAYNQHAYYLQTLSFYSSRLKNSHLRNSILAAPDPLQAYRLLAGISETGNEGL
ncbi:MAG: PTS sugar transporter subunit IIA [Treponema sp.]|jgi:PTS system nitrogen regulatory IIA component|nr:PTS sugar transporter subunit IIA [Treponema sp.]